jgi:hypothetical protein
MKKLDFRFNENQMQTLKKLIGKRFEKYRCDPFEFGSSVYLTLGIYVDDMVFELRNEQQTGDYFGVTSDFAVFNLNKTLDGKIESGLEDVKQIDTPINEIIKTIRVVNENQRLYENDIHTYDVWLTRGIIFYFNEIELSFEKDFVSFSEEINIRRGVELLNTFCGTEHFQEGWEDGILPECSRDIITISD